MQDGVEQQSGGVAAKGQYSGCHLIQHRAKGEKIGAGIKRLSSRLLRRHVGEGAQGAAGAGEMLLRRRAERESRLISGENSC